MDHGTTLTQFLTQQQHGGAAIANDLIGLITDVARACKMISDIVDHGDLRGEVLAGHGDVNVQGETQKRLDLIANDLMLQNTGWTGRVAGMASEEMEDISQVPEGAPLGRYLLLFDPLDGSSNIDVDASIGTIFSILPRTRRDGAPATAEFLQPGLRQVCAGYAVYGPSTVFVVSTGHGVHVFTLDRNIGEFVLTRRDVRIPEQSTEFSINSSNARFWEPAVREYVDDCIAGSDGPRGRNFNMRWIGSMVADGHRVISRGGVFMYPRDRKDPNKPSKLRLMYEVNPMAFVCEQAGGRGTTGYREILEVEPEHLHQRIAAMFGSREEIETLLEYHRRHR